MRIRYGIAAVVLFAAAMGSTTVTAFDLTVERYLLDKEGGAIQVEAAQPADKETRDVVRRQLQEEARNGVASATPAMQQHRKEIQYRFEKTARGGRLHITTKQREALLAVQDFLRLHMSKPGNGGAVVFHYVGDTSLIVVPVMINEHGPYKFLLDTGANKTILSKDVADSLGLPEGGVQRLLSASGSLPVTTRRLDILRLGVTRAEKVEIAVGNLPLMKTLHLDGLLGGDYLRLFKISIDYDNMIVDIQPCCLDSISLRTKDIREDAGSGFLLPNSRPKTNAAGVYR
jgi:predicted aspartyl protease